MKYFKKFLLLGIFALLGVSFCSAFEKIDLQVYGSSSNRVAKPSSVSMPYVICGSNGITLYTCMSSNTSNCASFTFTPPSAYSSWGNAVSSCYYYNYTSYDVNQYLYASADTTVSYYVLTDCSNSSSCDYSEYESQISTLQSQLNTATGSLATCNSNLSSCNTSLNTATGSLATCQSNLNTATGSLATCQSDLSSCQSQLPNGGSCSVSAYNSIAYSGQVSLSANSTSNAIDFGSVPNKTLCVTLSGNLGNNNYVKIGFYGNISSVASDSQEYWYDQVGKTVCMYANKRYFNINNPKSTSPTIGFEAYFLNDLLDKSVPCGSGSSGYTQSQCESEYNLIPINSINSQYCVNNGLCPSCPDQYTSLQCQEEYNLIPINDINENYCTLNFDLISPSDCPSSPSGSGTSRSALYVNNVQYLGSPSIYVNIPEIIDWRYTYNSGNMILDVEGYNVDTGYMADILTVQEYHPSSEDFTVAFVSFLTLGFPYVVVVLFVVFIRKLIRKIFKS